MTKLLFLLLLLNCFSSVGNNNFPEDSLVSANKLLKERKFSFDFGIGYNYPTIRRIDLFDTMYYNAFDEGSYTDKDLGHTSGYSMKLGFNYQLSDRFSHNFGSYIIERNCSAKTIIHRASYDQITNYRFSYLDFQFYYIARYKIFKKIPIHSELGIIWEQPLLKYSDINGSKKYDWNPINNRNHLKFTLGIFYEYQLNEKINLYSGINYVAKSFSTDHSVNLSDGELSDVKDYRIQVGITRQFGSYFVERKKKNVVGNSNFLGDTLNSLKKIKKERKISSSIYFGINRTERFSLNFYSDQYGEIFRKHISIQSDANAFSLGWNFYVDRLNVQAGLTFNHINLIVNSTDVYQNQGSHNTAQAGWNYIKTSDHSYSSKLKYGNLDLSIKYQILNSKWKISLSPYISILPGFYISEKNKIQYTISNSSQKHWFYNSVDYTTYPSTTTESNIFLVKKFNITAIVGLNFSYRINDRLKVGTQVGYGPFRGSYIISNNRKYYEKTKLTVGLQLEYNLNFERAKSDRSSSKE